MTENIYDIANQLERAIRSLPEYKAVVETKAKILADKDVHPLWDEFITAQNKVQDQIQDGQMPSKKEQERLQDLGKKIEKTPLLRDYFTQQQRLYIYVADLEKIVFSPLKELGE